MQCRREEESSIHGSCDKCFFGFCMFTYCVRFDRMGGLEEMAPAVSLSYLPSPEGTTLYLTGRGIDEETIEDLLDRAEARIVDAAGAWLYARSDIDLPELVAGLFSERGLTLATAESCTGGLIASRLTDIPGAIIKPKNVEGFGPQALSFNSLRVE